MASLRRTSPSAPAGGVPVCVLVYVPAFQSDCDVKLKDAAHEVLLISNPRGSKDEKNRFQLITPDYIIIVFHNYTLLP